MALTLTEAAKLSQNTLQRGVLETFIQFSPVLDRLPFEPIEGNAFAYNEEGALPGVAFRAVNAAYTESTGTVNLKTESLVILGGEADVDKFIVQTRGNYNDQRAVQTSLKTKALSYQFQDSFINGDTGSDVNSFDGLKKRLTGGQVLTLAVNGAPIVGNGTTDIDTFFDALDQLMTLVPFADPSNSAFYVNRTVRMRIASALRRKLIYTETRQNFGNTFKTVITYAGIPILEIGTNGAGTEILPFTETVGSSSLTSSIYLVRFGSSPTDQGVTGLTNGGVMVRDLGEQQVKPVYRTRIEFYCGLGVFYGKAAARLTGVLNG